MLAINGATVDLPAITQCSLYLERGHIPCVCRRRGGEGGWVGVLLTDMVVWTEARFSEKDSLLRVNGTTQSSTLSRRHLLSFVVGAGDK